MTARAIPLAGIVALAVLVSACSMSGIKPLPGNKSASAAIAAAAPVQAMPTPAGHVPKAVNVPRAGSDLLLGFAASERGSLDGLISHYSTQYSVPENLVRRVINKESGYNPSARNGPYYGLMQISYATAQSMGYRGAASGLLDAETNLKYAVKYLSGAYVVGGGNADQAVRNYSRGYYYDAKRQGLLEEVGLR